MKRLFALMPHGGLIEASAICVLAFAIALNPSANASQKKEARVTQVIQDVKLIVANTAPRPAAVNDDVREGTAVHTGPESRTELTFSDRTLTRLGANSVFSFNVGTSTFDLGQGSILMQVPPDGSKAKVRTAAVTAAITGGTALFGVGPPIKFMVLEGTGSFYPPGHPDQAITLHGGEMVTLTPDGHLIGPTTFDVKSVLETSELITDFPDLANLPLILAVIREQEALYVANPTPAPRDTTDTTDQRAAAESQESTGSSDKFGAPSTISSPNPYVINSSTQIQTDPTITTNGVTDSGKIYRGAETDGAFTTYAFGSTSSFDTASGINHTINDSGAVFKFTSLHLTGNPTVSTTNGETSLALIGVNGVTSGGPGGTLTFAGIEGLLIATENGSINLGSEISFAGLHDLNFYARGSGSNLTLGSTISASDNLRLFSEGTVQINGTVNTTNFTSFSGGDWLNGIGAVNAAIINITSLGNISLDADDLPDISGGGGQISLTAAATLSIANVGGTFTRESLNGAGATINLTGSTTFDFSASNSVSFIAGAGGINASTVDFFGHNLTLTSAGNIQISSAVTPLDLNENNILDGSISAGGSFTATGDVYTGSIDTGTTLTISGGLLRAGSINVGSNIDVNNGITAVGGSIIAGGNITVSNGSLNLEQNPPGTFGNITAGGNILAAQGIFTPGDPVVVHADGSITASGVITGTLEAGTDITLDNSADEFFSSLIANHVTAGGTLYLINTPAIGPNNASFSNHDGATSDDFTLMAGAIVSTGPTYALLSSNGEDANSDYEDSNPGNGGNITVSITAAGLSVGAGNNLDAIQALGGAFNSGGPYNGGNGGLIDITAAGDVLVNDPNDGGPAIWADTGTVSDIFSEFGGNGGTVNIHATGGITINGIVQVSSDDTRQFEGIVEGEGEQSGRESASGGTILLQSNLTTGTGITIADGGELLSLLNGNAPGPAGSITLSTEGADIVVNGTVRADFGTIAINQDDPVGVTPTITLDGGTLQSATFNINGAGDLDIGLTNYTAINIFGGTWNVPGDINLNAENTSFAYSFSLNATAGGSINFAGGNSDVPATLTLPLSGNTTFTAGAGSINAQYVDLLYSGGGLNLNAAGDITAHSIAFTDSYARGNVNAVGAITITDELSEGTVSAGTSIDVGGNITVSTLTAGTTVSAGGSISASSIDAGGDITADQTHVQTINSPTGILTVANNIMPDIFSTDPAFPDQGAKAPHLITIDSIVAPNGIDFSGNQFGGIDGYSSGGILTINARALDFNSDTGIGDVNFNGADAGATDFNNDVFTTVGGDGGAFTANTTTGDITVTSNITATTGQNLTDPMNPSAFTTNGAGGSVTLSSDSGAVSVDSTIQVSSDDPVPFSTATPMPYRKSAKGGNITMRSGKTSGIAINVGSSAQLLSLLNAAAPGPGGKITIVASASNNSGNNSSINIDNSNGLIAADGPGGTVDIEHHGDDGTININNANIRGDIVKVGAFGNNGTLNIGGGTINADSMLKLYAPGSNGHLNFIANVTLNSGSSAILAANTISIQPTIIVHITGSGGPATVYTNHPDYNFTPAPGYTGPAGNPSNGSFGDNGAHDPVPLASPIPTF